jgi:hypothetical protein
VRAQHRVRHLRRGGAEFKPQGGVAGRWHQSTGLHKGMRACACVRACGRGFVGLSCCWKTWSAAATCTHGFSHPRVQQQECSSSSSARLTR